MELELYPYIMDPEDREPHGSVPIVDRIFSALQSAWAAVFDASCDRSILALRARFEGLIAEAVEKERPTAERLAKYIGIDLQPDDLCRATAARIAWLPVAELTVDALFAAFAKENSLPIEKWAGCAWDTVDQQRYMRLTGFDSEKDALAALEQGVTATSGVLTDWPGLLNRYGRSVRLGVSEGWVASRDVHPVFFDAAPFGDEVALGALNLHTGDSDLSEHSLPPLPVCLAEGDVPTAAGEIVKVSLEPFEGSAACEVVAAAGGEWSGIRIDAVHHGEDGETDLVVAKLLR